MLNIKCDVNLSKHPGFNYIIANLHENLRREFYTPQMVVVRKLTSLKLAINLLAIVRLSVRKPARKCRSEELTMH